MTTQTDPHFDSMPYVNIELAWKPCLHDIPAKRAQGEMGEWLMDNIGGMGDPGIGGDEWHPSWKWAWSLSCGKFSMPVGIYFKHSVDALRFALTFPDTTRMTGRHCE